jgi:hypothetical protein
MRRVLAGLGALALLGACAGGGKASTATTAVLAPVSSGTTSTAASAAPPELAGASTAEVSVPVGPPPTPQLVGVRVAHQQGFDRVVFEFRGRVPGYRVGYVARPILEDASGREVHVDGDAVLRVHMEHASDADETGHPTYAGSHDLHPGDTTRVIEVVRTGGFEAVLTWAVGVSQRAPFRVQTLADPPRLVLDVATQ